MNRVIHLCVKHARDASHFAVWCDRTAKECPWSAAFYKALASNSRKNALEHLQTARAVKAEEEMRRAA